ncbi:MAG: hypothetical protein ACYC66_05890, partial [Chloroflexota bacterium]
KTSESIRNGGRCPKCGVKVTQDRNGKGFVSHSTAGYVRVKGSLVQCTYGNGERDLPSPDGDRDLPYGWNDGDPPFMPMVSTEIRSDKTLRT